VSVDREATPPGRLLCDTMVRSSLFQQQVMLHDRFLFNRSTGQWTVDKFLADVTARYGGVDTVLLWHSECVAGRRQAAALLD
jgi:hypothetical protein